MNVKDLKEAIKNLDDNDDVVIEVHDTVLSEDLYRFSIDIIDGIRLLDRSIIKEIRLCPIKNID